MRLAHVTLGRGHRMMVTRDQVEDAIVADVGELIDLALVAGIAPLYPPYERYAIKVERFGGAALVSVEALAAGDAAIDPVAVIGIAARARQGRTLWARLLAEQAALDPAAPPTPEPPAPWCGVVVLPGLASHVDALAWLGGFEQALAFAWMERTR